MAWKPYTVLDIPEIHDGFHCIGLTQKHEPCINPIKKENRTHAKQILRSISSVAPTSATFDEELEELVEMLLCWRHRKVTKQVDDIMCKWQRAIEIERAARNAGDQVMNEEGDSISSLDADIADLFERRLRLVKVEEDTRVKTESGVGRRTAR